MRRPAFVLVSLALVAVSAVPASAAAPPRTLRLISGGTSSVNNATSAGMAADGSRALFDTTEGLVPADTNGVSDVYARDTDGTLQLISSGSGAASSGAVGISADGDRTLYATSNADVPADTDTSTDIYERRRDGSLRQISAGNGTTFFVSFAGASANGDHVLFGTSEQVPGTGDTDAVNDLYDRRGDGSIRLVTPGTALTVSFFGNRNVLSADGTLATFFTTEALDPADIDGAQDSYSVPTTGGPYTLVTPGTPLAATGTVNRAGTRTWFDTTAPLLPVDTDTARDVYERRADGTVHLVSGGTANIDANLEGGRDDGSSMIFSTTEKLLPDDLDTTGVDLYDRRVDGSLHLVSGGSSDANGASYIGDNADGSVIFYTVDGLVPADTDGQLDVYLRRPDGGLLLLTPPTAGTSLSSWPTPNLPSTWARTVFAAPDLVGTGDTNGQGDVYEATSDGLRVLAPNVPGGTGFGFYQSADGSRMLFGTSSTIPGTGDSDTAFDAYEADFAVPDVVGVPSLAGTGKVGVTHTCTAPAITGEGLTTTFGWLRDATTLAGATAATYKPGLADAGHTLKCRVTARNAIGADTADSAARGILPAARASKLAGFPIVGTSLGCTTFAGATSTKYAWKRGTRTVKGRKARTYKVGTADLGKRLTCIAVGTKGTLATTATLPITVPRRCTVPSVRGLTPAAAKTKLGNAGCRSKTSKVTGSGVAKGLVLGTSPARGAKRANGARITIRVRR